MPQNSIPKNLKDLSNRLKEKKEQDRLLIQRELESAVVNLKNGSKESANTIKNDIESRIIKSWTRTLALISMGTLIAAGLLLLTLWGLASDLTETISEWKQARTFLKFENRRLSTAESSIQRVSGLSITTDKEGRIWLQMRPGLKWGKTFRSADGTEFYQILGR